MNKRTVAILAAILLLVGGAFVVWKTRADRAGNGARDTKAPTEDIGGAGLDSTDRGANPAPQVLDQRPVSEEDDPTGSLRLEGQVLDRDDRPVGGATVWVSARPAKTAVSEDDGSFAFDGLIERTYDLTASVGELTGGPVQHALRADSDPAVIRVREGGVLEVEVVGDENAPVAGAQVRLVDSIVERAATTDDAGVATLRGVPSGAVSVSAHAADYAPANTLVLMPHTAGARVRERIVLVRGAAVSGRVVDADGKPVADARVTPRAASEWIPFGNEAAAMSDKSGAWKLDAVPAGTFRFTATHPDHAPGGSDARSLDGKTEVTGVVIELGPAATLSGTVVTAAGQPAPYATVRIGPKDWNMWSGFDAGIRQAIADETGAFSFKGLDAVSMVATAAKDDATSATTEVDLATTPHTTGLVLTLDVTGVISGIVVNETGAPVPEAAVTAWPDFMSGAKIDDWSVRGSLSAMSDGAGAFAFRGLPPGQYRLRAGRGGGGSEMFMLQPGVAASVGDKNVRVVLAGDGGITGKVEQDDGSVPTAFTVRIGWTTPVPVAQKDGAFTVDDVPAGGYDVIIDGPGFARTTVPDVEVQSGVVKDLGTIVVKKGRSVSGRVVDPSGRPVANANVLLGAQLFSDGSKLGGGLGGLLDAQSGIRRVTTDARGDYRVSGVPKTESYIAAEHPDLGRSDTFRVGPGTEDGHVDLPLRAFGSLKGTVTAGGEPVGGPMVMVTPPGQMAPIMVTGGDDGTYAVDKLPEGDYAVTAMMMESGMSSRTASASGNVTAGKAAVVDLDIVVGDVTLRVNVATDDGSALAMAQVFLAPGKLTVKNGVELQKAFMSGAADGGQSQIAMQGKQATFTRLVPGRYSACILPIGGDMNDSKAMQRMQEHPELLAVHCRAVTVAASPKEQTFDTTVPAPDPGTKPLPESED